MNDLGLVARQTAYELRAYFRNKPALVFTFSFPIMFLLVFGLIGRNNVVAGTDYVQFFVPGMLTFAIMSACYTGLAMRIPLLRDAGVLKRLQGTPLPGWAYLSSAIGLSVIVAVILSMIILGLGVAVLGVDVNPAGIPGALVTMLVGAAALCALGLALGSLIPNGESAAPTVQMTVWPIVFVSDIFYPLDEAPGWLQGLGTLFPLKHLAGGISPAFDSSLPAIDPGHLGILLVWAVLGGIVASRSFRWEPSSHRRLRRHRRSA